MAPGRRFSMTTSAVSTRARNARLPASDFRSRATDSLLRVSRRYGEVSPPTHAPLARTGSPERGSSTLTTRAPRSASCMAAKGAAMKTPTSSTVIPVRGGWGAVTSASASGSVRRMQALPAPPRPRPGPRPPAGSRRGPVQRLAPSLPAVRRTGSFHGGGQGVLLRSVGSTGSFDLQGGRLGGAQSGGAVRAVRPSQPGGGDEDQPGERRDQRQHPEPPDHQRA